LIGFINTGGDLRRHTAMLIIRSGKAVGVELSLQSHVF
jgi:hypothetical protein